MEKDRPADSDPPSESTDRQDEAGLASQSTSDPESVRADQHRSLLERVREWLPSRLRSSSAPAERASQAIEPDAGQHDCSDPERGWTWSRAGLLCALLPSVLLWIGLLGGLWQPYWLSPGAAVAGSAVAGTLANGSIRSRAVAGMVPLWLFVINLFLPFPSFVIQGVIAFVLEVTMWACGAMALGGTVGVVAGVSVAFLRQACERLRSDDAST